MSEYVEEAYRVVQAWRTDKILMPLDLSGSIAVDDDGQVIPALSRAVHDCKKIVYLGSNTVWLLHQMGDLDDKVCMTATTSFEELEAIEASMLVSFPSTADVRLESVQGVDLPVGDIEDHHHYGETRHLLQRLARQIDVTTWPSQQSLQGMTAAQQERVATDERGLEWVRSDEGPDRLLAPESQRTMLLELVHTETNHASAAILRKEIGRDYWWPGISADCNQWYQRRFTRTTASR
jgi:Integrase zinc binding domain